MPIEFKIKSYTYISFLKNIALNRFKLVYVIYTVFVVVKGKRYNIYYYVVYIYTYLPIFPNILKLIFFHIFFYVQMLICLSHEKIFTLLFISWCVLCIYFWS